LPPGIGPSKPNVRPMRDLRGERSLESGRAGGCGLAGGRKREWRQEVAEELRALGADTVLLVVDMQRMFAEATEGQVPGFAG
jgi:hypothetical protein